MYLQAAWLVTEDAFLNTMEKKLKAWWGFISGSWLKYVDFLWKKLRIGWSSLSMDERGQRNIRGTMSLRIMKCTKCEDQFSRFIAWEKIRSPTRADPKVIQSGWIWLFSALRYFSRNHIVVRMASGPPDECPVNTICIFPVTAFSTWEIKNKAFDHFHFLSGM